jgi:hypothetical protein
VKSPRIPSGQPPGLPSHASSAAEADRHRAVLDDDGHAALPLRELQHAFEVRGVLLDLEVLERDVPPGVVLTGGFRVGSGVLPEDEHWHVAILPWRGRAAAGICETIHIMRALVAFALLLTAHVAFSGPAPATPAPLSPDDVARAVQDRDTGRDSRALMRMRLVDRRGRTRERALELTAREGGRAGDRMLVRFTYPNDIKGTGFLVWERPGAEDERFLYLPSLGRVRRISGEETQESFVGTDFTYEDIGGREFDDYTYRFAEENAVWIAPDGRSLPAYRLESRRKEARATFPRVVTLVLKDSFVVVAAEIFNRRDERQKAYTVRKLDRIEGIWTVLDSTMADELSHTSTALVIEKIDYNIGLAEADFSRRILERAP